MVAMPSRPSREQVLGTVLFKAELHYILSQKGFAPVAHFAFSPTNSTWTYSQLTGQVLFRPIHISDYRVNPPSAGTVHFDCFSNVVQDSLPVSDNRGLGPLITRIAFFVIDSDQVQSQEFLEYAYVDLRSVPNLR